MCVSSVQGRLVTESMTSIPVHSLEIFLHVLGSELWCQSLNYFLSLRIPSLHNLGTLVPYAWTASPKLENRASN